MFKEYYNLIFQFKKKLFFKTYPPIKNYFTIKFNIISQFEKKK